MYRISCPVLLFNILYLQLLCGPTLSTEQDTFISNVQASLQTSTVTNDVKVQVDQVSNDGILLLSNVPINQPNQHSQFLDSDIGKWFYWSVTYIAIPALSAICVLSNIINIVVFLKVGPRDGVSVIFIGLSISDMLYSSCKLINTVLRSLEIVMQQHPYVCLTHLAFIVAYYSRMAFDISMFITVFTGVQKCACVAIPFTFRKFFTFRSCLTSVVLMYVVTLVYYLPQFTNTFLQARVDPQFNRTRLLLKNFNPRLSKVFFNLNKALNRISIPFVAEVVLIFCVAIMTHKLRQAAATRHAMTSAAVQGQQSTTGGKSDSGSKLSAKELKAIRSVNIICLVFVLGTAPKCVLEGCDLALEEFGDHVPLYFFLAGLQDLVIGVSVAANIVVYYKFNTRYRDCLIGFIRPRSRAQFGTHPLNKFQ